MSGGGIPKIIAEDNFNLDQQNLDRNFKENPKICGNTIKDSTAFKLQKSLAKIILDVKYEQNMSQTCVDTILFKFKQYFNECLDLKLFEVNYFNNLFSNPLYYSQNILILIIIKRILNQKKNLLMLLKSM